MIPPIRPGCFVGVPPLVLPEVDGAFGEVDCRGVLRGVCCLPVVPRVAAGDSEPVRADSRVGPPDAPFPDFAAGSEAEAVGDGALLGCCCCCCCVGCCLAGVRGSGRPGR